MTSGNQTPASKPRLGPLDGVRVLEAGLLVQGPQACGSPSNGVTGGRHSSPPTTGVSGA